MLSFVVLFFGSLTQLLVSMLVLRSFCSITYPKDIKLSINNVYKRAFGPWVVFVYSFVV